LNLCSLQCYENSIDKAQLAKYFKFDRINFGFNVGRIVSTGNILIFCHAQLSTSLRMEFLADILKTHANECFDSFREDLYAFLCKSVSRIVYMFYNCVKIEL
jgi:hypothetical protein